MTGLVGRQQEERQHTQTGRGAKEGTDGGWQGHTATSKPETTRSYKRERGDPVPEPSGEARHCQHLRYTFLASRTGGKNTFPLL